MEKNKIIVLLDQFDLVDDLIQAGIDGIIVGNSQYTSFICEDTTLDQINELTKKTSVYVSVNGLYHESKISEIEKYLLQLNTYDIKGILFQDFGVLDICRKKQINIPLYYNPETLNTNYATLNYLNTLGIYGYVPSREIHMDEIIKIKQNTSMAMMMQVHGVSYVSQSNRHLLTNYFNEINKQVNTNYHATLTIQASNVEEKNYIYEDQFGTAITTTSVLSSLDVLDELINAQVDYFFINTLYLPHDYIIDVIKSYRLYIDGYKEDAFFLFDTYQNIKYTHGFLDDTTVYTIDHVRKREADGNK